MIEMVRLQCVNFLLCFSLINSSTNNLKTQTEKEIMIAIKCTKSKFGLFGNLILQGLFKSLSQKRHMLSNEYNKRANFISQ